MSAATIKAAIEAACTDLPALSSVHVFDALPSTNSWLAEREPPAPGRAEAALALHQTAGRGRRGKVWQSPPESGLCLSVAYQFAAMPASASMLSLALGVAIARALESLGVGDVMLKWPNDIVWQDHKLGGILVETSSRNGGFVAIAGVGINRLLPGNFSLGDKNGWSKGAVDLATAGVVISLADLAAAMVPALTAALADFEHADIGETIAAFNRRHWLYDRAAELDGAMLRCAEVDANGRLCAVDMQTGQLRSIDSGEVNPIAWSVPA